MNRGFFITGTDTHVGKTFVTTQLMKNWNGFLDLCSTNSQNKSTHQTYKVLGIKPVASGCMDTPWGLRHDDALLLQQTANVKLKYEHINPFCFTPPISPNIAAAQQISSLRVNTILKACHPALTTDCDFIFVEGCGGWLTPLNEQETFADLAQALGFEIILVVSIRLGCLNHALLSAKQIEGSGLKFAGWIANLDQPSTLCIQEIVDTLRIRMTAPLLGIMPFHPLNF